MIIFNFNPLSEESIKVEIMCCSANFQISAEDECNKTVWEENNRTVMSQQICFELVLLYFPFFGSHYLTIKMFTPQLCHEPIYSGCSKKSPIIQSTFGCFDTTELKSTAEVWSSGRCEVSVFHTIWLKNLTLICETAQSLHRPGRTHISEPKHSNVSKYWHQTVSTKLENFLQCSSIFMHHI